MIEGAIRHTRTFAGVSSSAWSLGEGPLAVCLHGFPDTPRTFRLLAPVLAKAGFRVVAPVLRGYEPSSQPPDGDYGLGALAGDVLGWMDAFGAARAHVIGHDWGANIAFATAAVAPARVESLTAMAVPHPAAFAGALVGDHAQLKRSWYVFLFQMRGLAEAIVAADDFEFLAQLWRDWSPGWRWDPGDFDAVRACFSRPGVLEAALGYYRDAFDPNAPGAAARPDFSRPISARTLGLAGALDGCIAADVFDAAMPAHLFSGGVSVKRVPDAGHFLHLEQPEFVQAAILDHVRG